MMHICMILTLVFSGFVVLLQSGHTGFGCYRLCSFLSIMQLEESVITSVAALAATFVLFMLKQEFNVF